MCSLWFAPVFNGTRWRTKIFQSYIVENSWVKNWLLKKIAQQQLSLHNWAILNFITFVDERSSKCSLKAFYIRRPFFNTSVTFGWYWKVVFLRALQMFKIVFWVFVFVKNVEISFRSDNFLSWLYKPACWTLKFYSALEYLAENVNRAFDFICQPCSELFQSKLKLLCLPKI